MNTRIYYVIELLFFLTLFFALTFLVYNQAISLEEYASDTQPHIIFLYKYFYGVEPYSIPHPLWHTAVYLFSHLGLSMELSAAVVSALLEVMWAFGVYYISAQILHVKKIYLLLITSIIIIIGPLCIPWYNKVIIYGQGSPNLFHNVTLLAVKPFALFSIWYYFEAIKNEKARYYIYSLIWALLSILAKPIFIIIFMPAVSLFVLFRHRSKKAFIYATALIALSGAILLYQYIYTFGSHGESHIIVDLFGVWSLSSRNIAISIGLALAFPLLLVLFRRDVLEDDYLLFSWIMVAQGIVLYSLFAQTGKYYSHGNFGWSYMIALSFIYLFSIVKFFEIHKHIALFKRILLYLLLSIQTMIGIYYFIKVLQGLNPMYISLYFLG